MSGFYSLHYLYFSLRSVCSGVDFECICKIAIPLPPLHALGPIWVQAIGSTIKLERCKRSSALRQYTMYNVIDSFGLSFSPFHIMEHDYFLQP